MILILGTRFGAKNLNVTISIRGFVLSEVDSASRSTAGSVTSAWRRSRRRGQDVSAWKQKLPRFVNSNKSIRKQNSLPYLSIVSLPLRTPCATCWSLTTRKRSCRPTVALMAVYNISPHVKLSATRPYTPSRMAASSWSRFNWSRIVFSTPATKSELFLTLFFFCNRKCFFQFKKMYVVFSPRGWDFQVRP